MRVISYGEPSMFGNPNELFQCGRKRNYCDCDDCDDNCEYDFFCNSDCPSDNPYCSDYDCDDDCYYLG